MKKYLVFGLGLSVMFAFTSCKSQESAYKKAYEKAKQQQVANVNGENNVIANQQQTTPIEVTPVVTPTVVSTPAADPSNVSVRTESVSLINGAGLKAYSVVVGSFGVKANAEGLQRTLINAGRPAQIVLNNAATPTYRVVIDTFADKNQAVQLRNAVNATYPGAWLLYQK